MATPSDESLNESNFVIEESGTEMAWLFQIDTILTKGMGGLFSERSDDLSGIRDILDIGCGPGGWTLDLARVYPEKEVTGIDVSKPVIDYACAHAQARGFENAHFLVMNALEPLEFPDNSFDLVNARTILGFMSLTTWPELLQECKRVTRPGGVVRLTEFDIAITSSSACRQMWEWFAQALYITKRTFSPDGKQIGVIHQLVPLLREAGYQDIQHKFHAMDLSPWTEDFEGWYQNYSMVFDLLKPFIVSTGVTTTEAYEPVYQQMCLEMRSEQFCGIAPFLTVWGQKP